MSVQEGLFEVMQHVRWDTYVRCDVCGHTMERPVEDSQGTDICEDCLARLCVRCLNGPREVDNLCDRCAIEDDRETSITGRAR